MPQKGTKLNMMQAQRKATDSRGMADLAFHGYMIRRYPMSKGYWIEKDGITIQNYAASVGVAKGMILELIGG